MPPGRVDENRPAPVRFRSCLRALGGCSAALAFWACAAGARPPNPELASVWRRYQALPDERALAIAGELRSDRWVSGASGGHDGREEAESEALLECQRQRAKMRMQSPCRVYAVGDEVVWTGP